MFGTLKTTTLAGTLFLPDPLHPPHKHRAAGRGQGCTDPCNLGPELRAATQCPALRPRPTWRAAPAVTALGGLSQDQWPRAVLLTPWSCSHAPSELDCPGPTNTAESKRCPQQAESAQTAALEGAATQTQQQGLRNTHRTLG